MEELFVLLVTSVVVDERVQLVNQLRLHLHVATQRPLHRECIATTNSA